MTNLRVGGGGMEDMGIGSVRVLGFWSFWDSMNVGKSFQFHSSRPWGRRTRFL